jgi:hypothetical protein
VTRRALELYPAHDDRLSFTPHMPARPDPLTPERLALLLEKLNEVMAEASRLRKEVTRQFADQRRSLQQRLSTTRKKATKRR